MDKKDFIDNLNKVTLELDSPILFHRTKIDNLKSILADGALLPLKSREEYNFNYGFELENPKRFNKKVYNNYLESVFVGFKSSTHSIKSKDMFGNSIEDKIHSDEEIEKENVVFIIDPYSMKEEVLKNSFLSLRWNHGRIDSTFTRKWNVKKSIEVNMERWEKFLTNMYIKYTLFSKESNEVVIRNPKGINFNDILNINPKGVMIVVNMKKVSDEVKNLVEQYPEYQWVFVS